MVDESLKNYIESTILPLYDDFDAAHQRNHVNMAQAVVTVHMLKWVYVKC